MIGEFDYFKAKTAIVNRKSQEAIKYLTEALSYDPRNTLYLQQLAQLYLFGLKDYEKAREVLSNSLVDLNGDTTGWSGPLLMGICDLQLNKFDRAEKEIGEALRLNPNHVEAQKIIAALMEREKK